MDYRLNNDVDIKHIINSLDLSMKKHVIIISVGNIAYVVNSLNKDRILKTIKEGEIQEFGTGSDRDFMAVLQETKDIKLMIIKDKDFLSSVGKKDKEIKRAIEYGTEQIVTGKQP